MSEETMGNNLCGLQKNPVSKDVLELKEIQEQMNEVYKSSNGNEIVIPKEQIKDWIDKVKRLRRKSDSKDEVFLLKKVQEQMAEKKHSSDGNEIVIPKGLIQDWIDQTEEYINATEETSYRRVAKPVQILNNTSSTAASSFVNCLQTELGKKHHIVATVIEDLDQVLSEQKLVVICNKAQYPSSEKAAAQCMREIKEELKEKTILIVLHVTRQAKLPSTISKKELSGTDFSKIGTIVDMGFENDQIYSCQMNDSAFKEVQRFVRKCEKGQNGSEMQTTEPKHSPEEHQLKTSQEQVERQRIKVKSYIVDPSSTSATESFIKEFQSRMLEAGIPLYQKQIGDAKEIDPDSFLFVVCNAATRIESDIEACLNKFHLQKVYSRIILIVLHVGRKGKETSQSTKQKLKISSNAERYANLDSVIDIAFNVEDGIYACIMNEKAFDELKAIDVEDPTTMRGDEDVHMEEKTSEKRQLLVN